MIETKLMITCDRCGKTEEKKGIFFVDRDIQDFLRIKSYTKYDASARSLSYVSTDTKVLCKECAMSYESAAKALRQGFMGGDE